MLSFSGRHYPRFIILQCVRWYKAYALSYRNIEEMVAERGFEIVHATLNRWVLHYAPLLEQKAIKHKRPAHRSWRMNETSIKIKGKWRYLYRAVNKYGATIEFMLSKRRDAAAAKAFFRKAFRHNRMPYRTNIDKSGANRVALDHFNKPGIVTSQSARPNTSIILLNKTTVISRGSLRLSAVSGKCTLPQEPLLVLNS